MSRRPHSLAFGGVVILVLVLLNLPDDLATRAKLATGSLFLPLFGFVSSGQQLGQRVAVGLLPRRTLAAEVARLERENHDLRARIIQGEEALRENARLRQIVGWQQQTHWKVRAARILSRDPANWWRTARIDLGSRDGVRADLPVLAVDGLVGKIGDVGLTSSEVIFIGDPECRVAVVVRETGEQGVLSASASGVLDHRLVDLTHLPRHTALRPGQTVGTSGLGGVFPAGLPVGTVVDYRSVGYGLYTEARVKMAADTSRLRDAMVLFP